MSVGPSVHWSVTLLKFLPKSYLNRITAPAHPYATDAVVYTALFFSERLSNTNGWTDSNKFVNTTALFSREQALPGLQTNAVTR